MNKVTTKPGKNGHQKQYPGTVPDIQQPFNTENEEAFLGAVLIDPDNIVKISHVNLLPEDFFIIRNGWLWDALLTLHRNGTSIDLLTISDELKRRGQLVEFGNEVRLTELINLTPSSLHSEAYANEIKRCSVLRQLISAAGEISRLAFSNEVGAYEAIEQSSNFIVEIAKNVNGKVTPDLEAMGHSFLDKLEIMRANGNCITGLPTGLKDLDTILGGLQRGDMIVLAGRPAMGKSAMALQLCLDAAKKYRGRSLYFNREMSAELLYQRMMAYESGIDAHRLRANDIKDDEYPVLLEAINTLAGYKNLIIIDDHTATAEAMKARALVENDKNSLDLIVVDYIQIVEAIGNGKRNKASEVGDISKALKRMARDVNVPVVAISSLSRNCEYRTDKRPQLSDLRESGDIEHDADIVIFIYRDEIYNPNTEYVNIAELNISKHRQGPTGTFSVYFKKCLTKFLDLEIHKEPLDWVK